MRGSVGAIPTSAINRSTSAMKARARVSGCPESETPVATASSANLSTAVRLVGVLSYPSYIPSPRLCPAMCFTLPPILR